jgi:polar amino acid transport system substrate-binding protein
VIFEEMKPMYHKTDAGYEGLGVDVLEQIRIQAKRRKVDYRVATSVNDGIGANNDPAATGFSYRISVQGCH